jgi:hypothetical protein
MWRFSILTIFLCLLIVLAQEQTDTSQTDAPTEQTAEGAAPEQSTQEKRIIRIDSSGGNQEGDLRFGPIIYTHPDPEGVKLLFPTFLFLGRGQNSVDLMERKFLLVMRRAGALQLFQADSV